ncbi:MAG: YdcF family protein, partial [Bryobacterales bacterium]|nr:YdcF family protein [Bryobacterales bacterium]
RIITTGGAGGDPLFTEGEVGRDYLIRRGVPPEKIIVEDEGGSTAHSIAATGEILRRMNLASCVVVTDWYHVYRAKRMLQRSGITAYGSPRSSGNGHNNPYDWWLCVRQASAYLLWRAGVAI